SGNDTVISNYGTEVADPYGLSLFRATDSARARLEYQRMDTFVDSARSRNALAVLDMQNHDLQTATEELHKAIEINPNFDSPYMNLGEIDVVNGNPSGAISMYRKALEINPRRAFTKMRLEQLLKASP
ncbi:MAG TPA: hypothetical protein VLH19_03115, partial [Patescibacteria group bacterium]|nr:hypothetical protein [Patescibacteria group bacterium]